MSKNCTQDDVDPVQKGYYEKVPIGRVHDLERDFLALKKKWMTIDEYKREFNKMMLLV